MQTEPGNVNFVFSTPSAIDEQWAYYYTVVPALTAYFVAVVERELEFGQANHRGRPVSIGQARHDTPTIP